MPGSVGTISTAGIDPESTAFFPSEQKTPMLGRLTAVPAATFFKYKRIVMSV